MRIRSILLFLIFMIVFANMSVAQDSPLIHNFSNGPLPKITNMEGPGGITHRLPPYISIGDIRTGRLDNSGMNRDLFLFSWDDIPGNDTARFIKILRSGFRIEWAEKAAIEKIDSGMTIKVSNEQNSLLLKLNDEKTRVNLTINNTRIDVFIARMNNGKLFIYKSFTDNAGQAGLFSRNATTNLDYLPNRYNLNPIESPENVKYRSPNIQIGDIRTGRLDNLSSNKNLFLFSWNDIPGNDTARLIKSLGNMFHIEWIKTATIEKIDSGMNLKVSNGNNSILLKLNDDKTKVNLTINDGRTDEFIARMENSKLNIYKSFGVNAAHADLLSRNTSTNIGQLPRAYTATATTAGTVHNINKGTDYNTIQAAIDDANPGDEIHVDSGTYYENVNVTKQLTLRGIGMPVVDASGNGSAITLSTNGITLEGFNATNAQVGIEVTSNNNTLVGNNASNNNGEYGGGTGISLLSSSNNTLSGNTANWNGYSSGGGISLSSSNNNTLSGNNANSNYNYGISLSSSSNNTLSGNNGDSNGDYDVSIGIILESSSNNTLIGNSASSNYGWAFGYGYGIYLSSSSDNKLIGNKANSNYFNCFGWWCDYDIGSGYSIYLSSSNNNLIYNNIFDNTNNVQLDGSNNNTWNTTRHSGTNIIGGSYLGGNVWATPEGTGFSQNCEDDNKDGICDLVYTLDSTNIDYYPLGYRPVHNIKKGTNYSTIQAAINAANPGDEIHVDGRIYFENVDVTKQLTLRGIGMPVVDAGFGRSAITISANGITLEGFNAIGAAGDYESDYEPGRGINVISNDNTLIGNNANSNYGYYYWYGDRGIGILLQSASNNTLIRNNAEDNGFGISLFSSNNNTLSGNNANSNTGRSIYDDGDSYGYGYGISLSSSNNNTLIGNNANSNSGGANGGFGNYGYGYGIFISSSSNNTLIGNNANSNCGGGGGGSSPTGGYGFGYGILLSSSSSNTLNDNNANSNSGYGSGGGVGSGYGYGILLSSSSDNTLKGNNANSNSGFGDGLYVSSGLGYGILLISSGNNTLSGNNANSNSGTGDGWWGYGYGYSFGILLSYSSQSLLINNIMEGNTHNFGLEGSSYSDFDNKIDKTNLVGGKPVYYLNSAINTIYDSDTNAGTFYCISCVNVTLKNLDLNSNLNGIFFWNTSQSRIQNVTASYNGYSISLSSSNNNTLFGNTASNNFFFVSTGISLSSSSNNMLSGNNANSNGGIDGVIGISLSSSNNNTLIGNDANSNSAYSEDGIGGIGISLSSSSNNTLISNNVNSNCGHYDDYYYLSYGYGIFLSSSSNNTLIDNNASNNGCDYYNGYGISLSSSTNNKIYHNNLIDNLKNQANDDSTTNLWDNGYPSGGNYFSDYAGNDSNNDGIGDTPYNISAGAQDRYPLMTRLTTGPVHNINKGTSYPTIQEAIDYASPGNEIHVDSGTYLENVNVNKKLTIRGIGMPVVDASGNGSAITLLANGITLEGFNAKGSSSNLEAGIKVTSNNNTIGVNNVSNNYYGIYLLSSSNNTLNSNFANLNNLGIFLSSSNFNKVTSNKISNNIEGGIRVYNTSKNNTISGNKVTNSSSGIFFVYAFNTTASNNIMENNLFNFGVGGNLRPHFEGNNIDTTNLANGKPIYYVKYGKNTIYDGSTKGATFYCILCNNVTIKNMEMSNMDRGIYFWETSNSRIQNITVKESGWGIYLRLSSNNNTIQDSRFSTNNILDYYETGVSVISSDNNTFENNTFILNNYGIELYSSSKNTIYNNYFNNTNNFVFSGNPVNIWNVTKKPGKNIIGGSYLGGNFWANPAGTGFSQTCLDGNNDGLCDLKYSLNTINVDYLPLTVPPKITVVSPNGSESWIRGTTQTIKWNSSGSPGAYVKIELLKAGIFNRTIIASTPNDGTHPWPILATQAPGTDYKVKITSTANPSYNDTSDNNFTIPVPSFKVVFPNGSENWRRGTTQTIKWNSTENPKAYVKIELLKPGVANKVIISSTLNDGSHPWLIPANQLQGTDYKVKITSTINASINDTSDDNFTIPAPSFTVVSPNGGENWTRGTTQTIKWNSTENPKSYVKIELLKPGVANKVIIAGTLNDGSQSWLIPATQLPGDDYKVKITSTINLSVNDTSDDNFTILPPKINVTSPNGGENWTRGTAHAITWNYTGNPGTYVKIELLKNGVVNRTILSSTLNDKSQGWTIPTTQAIGTDYRIRITSTTNAAYNDTSDGNFNISSTIP